MIAPCNLRTLYSSSHLRLLLIIFLCLQERQNAVTQFILQNWPVLRVRLVSPPSTLHAGASGAPLARSDGLGTPAKAPSTQANTAQLSTPQTAAVSLHRTCVSCSQYGPARLHPLTFCPASTLFALPGNGEMSSLPSPRATDFQELSHSALAKVRAPTASRHFPASLDHTSKSIVNIAHTLFQF